MAIDRRSEPHTTNERFAGNFISETASQRATGVRHEIDRKAPYTLPESTGRIYDPCPRAVDTARGHGSCVPSLGQPSWRRPMDKSEFPTKCNTSNVHGCCHLYNTLGLSIFMTHIRSEHNDNETQISQQSCQLTYQ